MRFDLTIAGELNLDLILNGLPLELPFERELLASSFDITLGSSSAILAHNAACLGISTGFITTVADDDFGNIAQRYLHQQGVDLSRIVPAPAGTQTGVTVLLPHGSTRRILTYPGAMALMSSADLDVEYLAQARHFHLSSLFLQPGLHPALPELFRNLRSRGLTLSLDTNDDPADRWDGVLHALLPEIDILLPNRDELCRMTACDSVEAALEKLAPVVPTIVVKCGSEGAIVQQGRRRSKVPSISVQPVDAIGAGDSFNAGFLAAWLSGHDAVESARAGNIAGALSTQRPGGVEAFRDKAQRDSFLQAHAFPKTFSRCKVSALSNGAASEPLTTLSSTISSSNLRKRAEQ